MENVQTTARLVLLLASIVSTAALAHGPANSPETAPAAIENDRRIQFPDTADYQTLVVDLHTHSVFSDGHVWPNIRVEEALRDGLDAVAITEHLEWQPHLEDIPHPDRNRSFEEARSSNPEGSQLIVIPGSEITRSAPHGHMNAVFIKDANALFRPGNPPQPYDPRLYFRDAGTWPAQQAVDAANAQGAFVFWNHSWSDFPSARTEMTEFHSQNAADGKLHGIEVANGNTYSEESFQIALDHNLALIGVSDVHNLIDWDYEPHRGGHRPVNLVFVKERSSDGIRAALFANRTVVWFENLLIGRADDLIPLLNASLSIEAKGYAPNREVLEVALSNRSDAHFQLRSLSDYSFTSDHALIEVAPHTSIELRIRRTPSPGTLRLDFEVMNALTAPGSYAKIQLSTPTL